MYQNILSYKFEIDMAGISSYFMNSTGILALQNLKTNWTNKKVRMPFILQKLGK